MFLTVVRSVIANHSDKRAFMRIVGRYYPPDDVRFKCLDRAYQLAQDEFKNVYRDGGDLYFEHIRAVALIVMVYLRIRDVDVIIAALLHDIVEDIPGWNYHRVRDMFGEQVATLVWYVTKPKVEEFGGDKQARNRRYHENFLHAPRMSVVIKLADRLHNLITLWETDEDKRRRKIAETQDFYLSLAEREIVLIHEIEEALAELQAPAHTVVAGP